MKNEKINLNGVKNIVVVASGKGGVGKSTVSANIAVSLMHMGYKVAIVDADIYGPSIPKMFGVENMHPEIILIDGKEMMNPIEKNKIKIMSIGFFVDANQGLIWRGPMVSNAIMQLFENTNWGDIDFMIIDFPPGTGDIQLTATQKLIMSGAILVTTPQEISLNDARKAASMFMNPDINLPIIGVIENMSYFIPEKHPDEQYFIFGKNGGRKMSEEYKTKLLGQIPLVIEVGEAADIGKSVFELKTNIVKKEFENISQSIVDFLNK